MTSLNFCSMDASNKSFGARPSAVVWVGESDGSGIPIEERDAAEIIAGFGQC